MADRPGKTTEAERPFLSRWSERKRAVQDAEGDPQGPAAEADAEGPAGDEQEEMETNRAAAEAIDLESLTDKSDYAPFLKSGVPAVLKSAALQRLWRSNPVFAVLDGLNDYDLDYTFPKAPAGGVRTAWKIGRGLLSDEDLADSQPGEAAGEALEETLEEAPELADAQSVAEGAEAAEAPAPDPGEQALASADPPEAPEEPDAEAGEPAGPVSAPLASEARQKVGLARRIDMSAFAPSEDRER